MAEEREYDEGSISGTIQPWEIWRERVSGPEQTTFQQQRNVSGYQGSEILSGIFNRVESNDTI